MLTIFEIVENVAPQNAPPEGAKPLKAADKEAPRVGRSKSARSRRGEAYHSRTRNEPSKDKRGVPEEVQTNGKPTKQPERRQKDDVSQKSNEPNVAPKSADAKIPELDDPWADLENLDGEVINFNDLKKDVAPQDKDTAFRGRRGRGFRGRGRGGFEPYDRDYHPRRNHYAREAEDSHRGRQYGRKQSLDDSRNGNAPEPVDKLSPRDSRPYSGFDRRYGSVRGRGRGMRGFKSGNEGYDRQYVNGRPRGRSVDDKGDIGWNGYSQGRRTRFRHDQPPAKSPKSPTGQGGAADDPMAQGYYDEQYAAYYAGQAQYYGSMEGDDVNRPTYHQDYYQPTQVTYDANGEPILLAQNPFGLLVPLHYHNGAWVHPTAAAQEANASSEVTVDEAPPQSEAPNQAVPEPTDPPAKSDASVAVAETSGT